MLQDGCFFGMSWDVRINPVWRGRFSNMEKNTHASGYSNHVVCVCFPVINKLILNHAKCTQMFELTTKMLMVMMKKMKMASQIFRLQNPDSKMPFHWPFWEGEDVSMRGVRTTRWLLAGIGFNIDSGHTRISPVKDPFLSTGVQFL